MRKLSILANSAPGGHILGPVPKGYGGTALDQTSLHLQICLCPYATQNHRNESKH